MGQATTPTISPLDAVVADLIAKTRNEQKGFTLALAEKNGEVKVSFEEKLKPNNEFLPPADYRAHVLTEATSLVAFAQKYGTKESSVIYVGTDGATFVIDESVTKGSRETIRLDLPLSDDFAEWKEIFSDPHEHKELLQFLREHEDNLVDPNVLVVLSSIRATSTVNYESEIKDDGKTIGMVFKTQGGDEMKKFPKQFGIRLPVLRADEGDLEMWKSMAVNLTVEMPSHPTDKPTFTLFCPELRNVHRRRMSEEAAALREGLKGWLVVEGSYGTKPHEIKR